MGRIVYLKRMFVDGIYSFDIKDKVCVIDIGMNVGIASLYFASHSFVEHVYSFEPLPITYQQAKINLSLNKNINSKITALNFGVGDSNKTIEVEFVPKYKGSVGMLGFPEELKSTISANEIKIIPINIRDIAIEIKEIIKKEKDKPLIAKIDCEGAEYEIIQSLSNKGLVEKFYILMNEWHEKGPQQLSNILTQHGFATFAIGSVHKRNGMLYAVHHQ